jgi:Trk K+ transport system NAD-binding subunit
MGGRLCASAAFEPDVAYALEDMTQGDFKSDILEFLVRETTPIVRQTIGEAEILIRKHTGCLLIGYARPGANGEFENFVNPPTNVPLQPGDALLVIGSLENVKRFRHWYGIDQGR